jgi:hypothetical protein
MQTVLLSHNTAHPLAQFGAARLLFVLSPLPQLALQVLLHRVRAWVRGPMLAMEIFARMK